MRHIIPKCYANSFYPFFLYRVKWEESFPTTVTISFRPWVGHLFKACHIFLAHSQFSLFALFQIVTQNIILHIKRLQVLPALYVTVNSNQPRALIYKPTTWGIIHSFTSHPPTHFLSFSCIYFTVSKYSFCNYLHLNKCKSILSFNIAA